MIGVSANERFFKVNIRRILLLSAAVTMLATPAISGFYLGAQAGGVLTRGDVNYTDRNVQQNTTGHTRGMGAAFGGHLGYLYQLTDSHMFVLGEGYFIKESGKSKSHDLVFRSSASASSATTKGAFTAQSGINYGASLGFGAFMNPKFNLYVKVGFESKGVTTTYTLPNASPADGTEKSAWAISPGAGFMYKMTNSIALNPEFTYVIGKKYKVLPETTNANGTYSKSISFTPTEYRLMLKLNYMFR